MLTYMYIFIFRHKQSTYIYTMYIYSILFFLSFFNRTNYSRFSSIFCLSLIDMYLHKKRIMLRNSILILVFVRVTYGSSPRRRAAVNVGCQAEIAAAIAIFPWFFLCFTQDYLKKLITINSTTLSDNNN